MVAIIKQHLALADTSRNYSENAEIWISGYPDFQKSGNLDFRKSGFPDIRISGNPDFRKSRNPDFQISGDSDFGISGNPDFQKSEFPEIRKSGYPDFQSSGFPEIRNSINPDNPDIRIYSDIQIYPDTSGYIGIYRISIGVSLILSIYRTKCCLIMATTRMAVSQLAVLIWLGTHVKHSGQPQKPGVSHKHRMM